MTKFEYKTLTVKMRKGIFKQEIDINGLEQKINQLGGEGWELISNISNLLSGYTHQVFLIFKREIS